MTPALPPNPDVVAPGDVSVIVQGDVRWPPANASGPSSASTREVLASVRRHLPGAELILSTWKGSDLSGMDADLVLENDDPGATPYLNLPGCNNCNRQIVSTRAGLHRADRPYAMKLRSDTPLIGDGFLTFHGRFRKRMPLTFVTERVLACTVHSWNPRNKPMYLFSPADTFHFGLTGDVRDIWDIPTAPEPETTHWFATRPRPLPDLDPTSFHRYQNEQAVWLGFLRKHMKVTFDFHADNKPGLFELSETSILANLVLLEPRKLGIRLPFRLEIGVDANPPDNMYSFDLWRQLYDAA